MTTAFAPSFASLQRPLPLPVRTRAGLAPRAADVRRIDVHVAHPQPLIQEGLCATLAREPDFVITTPGDDASAATANRVVVTDFESAVESAHAHGRSGARGERQRYMVVTRRDREGDVTAALRAGVRGYVIVGAALSDLVDGIRALAAGSTYICPDVAQRVAQNIWQEPLTGREVDVLRSLAEGGGNKAIGRELGITADTVKAHLKSIFAKLGTASRTEAAAVALRRGLV